MRNTRDFRCVVPNCNHRQISHGGLCSTHFARKRRHGHIEQQALEVRHLRSYVKRVQDRIKLDRDHILWDQVRLRWVRMVEMAQSIVDERTRGLATNGWRHKAAEEILGINTAINDPIEVMEMVGGVYFFQEENPHFFKDDYSFRAQLVRRVRGLNHGNRKVYHYGENCSKTAYKEPPPKAREILAEWLVKGFGVVALAMIRKDRERAQKSGNEEQAFKDAFRAYLNDE